MIPQQFDRWHEFASRMARTWFKRKRRPNAGQIAEMVEGFFGDCRTGAYGIDPECWCSIRTWDANDPYQNGHKYAGPNGFGRDLSCPPVLCDLMSDYEEEWMENYWQDDMNSAKWERRRDQWCDPPTCCIRAGFDLAVAQSGGVLGFTAGHVRRMYPDGLPEWVVEWYSQTFDSCPRGFEMLPDIAPVWL